MEEKKSIVRAWVEAARPRTLPASVSPVLVGVALAACEGATDALLTTLCFIVALAAQVASNFANDYFDFKAGADRAGRLGPQRAVAEGWIAPRDMLIGTFVALGIACVAGLLVVYLSDWRLIFVGLAIAVCVLAYSAGPLPLAYNGLGDVCVWLFYGIIPVCCTYYVLTLRFSTLALILSVALGLLSGNILIVNNYRDYDSDRAAGKRTTVVLFGRRFARGLYIFDIVVAFLLVLPLLMDAPMWLLAGFALLFAQCCRLVQALFTWEGRALNKLLANTAQSVFFFALLLSLYFFSL